MDRTPGGSKAVDPATRLSELLAQSLEELTRPVEPPKPPPAPEPPPPPPVRLTPAPVAAVDPFAPRPPRAPVTTPVAVQPAPVPPPPAAATEPTPPPAPTPVQAIVPPAPPVSVPEPFVPRPGLAAVKAEEPPPMPLAPPLAKSAEIPPPNADDLLPPLDHHDELLPPAPTSHEYKADADKAIAELEAELFAAAKQIPRGRVDGVEESAKPPAEGAVEKAAVAPPAVSSPDKAKDKSAAAPAVVAAPPLAPASDPQPDADAARVIAKVRKLMLISMAVTLIAVGSVFGLIGYRVYKNEGATAKTADKLPEAAAAADMTLALPRGARVVQSAVSGDRLVITLDIGGKVEIRTFDVNTLQPAGRLNFSATP